MPQQSSITWLAALRF